MANLAECLMCGHGHDRSFSLQFCSNSCRLVYLIRRSYGWVVRRG